jgi:hypothetical protein
MALIKHHTAHFDLFQNPDNKELREHFMEVTSQPRWFNCQKDTPEVGGVRVIGGSWVPMEGDVDREFFFVSNDFVGKPGQPYANRHGKMVRDTYQIPGCGVISSDDGEPGYLISYGLGVVTAINPNGRRCKVDFVCRFDEELIAKYADDYGYPEFAMIMTAPSEEVVVPEEKSTQTPRLKRSTAASGKFYGLQLQSDVAITVTVPCNWGKDFRHGSTAWNAICMLLDQSDKVHNVGDVREILEVCDVTTGHLNVNILLHKKFITMG